MFNVSATAADEKSEQIVTDGSLTPTDSSFVPSPTTQDPTKATRTFPILGQIFDRRLEQAWNASVLSIRPLLGLLALIVSIACMLVSLAILLASDDQPVTDWTVQPTVYLAIASALANTALGFSRFYAVPLAWWYSVSRGNSIKDLERQWEAGYSVVLALRHNVHMGFTGFATLLVALMILDGPLLQKATSVRVATKTTNVTIALKLAPELPSGFAGNVINSATWPSGAAIQISNDWKMRAPIVLEMSPCNGTCRVAVRAPGVTRSNCTSRTWAITGEMIYDPNATWGNWRIYEPSLQKLGNPLLFTSVQNRDSGLPPGPELAQLDIGLFSFDSPDIGPINGSYVKTVCDYIPAILEYDLVITGKQAAIENSRTVGLANNTLAYSNRLPREQVQPCTIDSLTQFLGLFVTANASLYTHANRPVGAEQWAMDPTAMSGNAAAVGKYLDYTKTGQGLAFVDPTSDIINSLNELLFRGGVVASGWANITDLTDEGLSVEQVLHGNQTTTQNVYRSDLRWFAGAAVLEILAVMFVLPLFFGWWTLGNAPLLSPMELGLAFDAPCLKEVNSATGSSGVVQKVGDVHLKYGAIHTMNGPGIEDVRESERMVCRLGIAESQNVQKPTRGQHFEV
ncbi:hypothetical protein LTR97_008683 [Elasticomyces elasticus]|uniref:Uncharacterized protein n=1 Tax=Elasticomyces elasticus TaxID=574655 RepID=A0AAN7ZZW6_9PEZI|nr:hypothetical protein LTR97_008683 [Elasticomyces elasticus]